MEHYYKRFYEYVEEIIPLTETDKQIIGRTFKAVFLSKDTILESAEKVPQHHNFIVSGYLRMFHLDEDDNEITTDLNNGSRFFTSYQHFMNRTVSNDNIHCISDCEVLQISFENAKITALESQTQREFTIKLFENLLAEAKQRNHDMANLTAEKRYHKFSKDNPNILKNVPLSYIASYLGITQRHLSRLRKVLIQTIHS